MPAALAGVFAAFKAAEIRLRPLRGRGFFRSLRERDAFAAPSSFSLPEKEERPAGVEEKEGRLLSACTASPVGAENLS